MRELSGVYVNRGRLCILCAEVSRRLHREGGRSLQVGKVTGRGFVVAATFPLMHATHQP